jgi:hypothetical protein
VIGYDAAAMKRAVALGILLAVVTAAGAQTPPKAGVALVLEVSGGRIAGIEPYREVVADTTVTVPAGVRFVFQHYGSCRRFTLVGGGATFRSGGVDFAGNARPSDVRVACPHKVTLKDDGASAGVLMRSIGPPRVTISSRPDFAIVGPRAAEFSGLRVKRGNELILEQTVITGSASRWPQDAPPLAAAANYDLELLPLAADRKPVVIGLRTLDTSAPDERLTLVNVE